MHQMGCIIEIKMLSSIPGCCGCEVRHGIDVRCLAQGGDGVCVWEDVSKRRARKDQNGMIVYKVTYQVARQGHEPLSGEGVPNQQPPAIVDQGMNELLRGRMRLGGDAGSLAAGAPLIATDAVPPVPKLRRIVLQPRYCSVRQWKPVTGTRLRREIRDLHRLCLRPNRRC